MTGFKRKKPNIIFIMTDDHAFQAMSCYDSKINKTPNLDRIANEGMLFENCFCTNSICAPSRAVILTGKYSHLNGVLDNYYTSFNSKQQTFPKLLQRSGYQTAMIGKWHLKSEPQGFDYWNVLPGQGSYYNPNFKEMGKIKNHTGYVTDIITDLTLKWLENRDKSKPFLLMCQHKAPHANWMPGPKHLTMYDDITILEPDTLFDDYSTRSDAARQQTMSISKNLLATTDLKLPPAIGKSDKKYWTNIYNNFTEEQRKAWDAAYGPKNKAFHKANLTGKDLVRWKYQRFIKDYLRCIASVDDNVGRILDYIDAEGLTNNTIVVYTSDQGFYLGEHGWFDKRFMYKESFKMPLLVRYHREIKPGSVNKNLVMNLDFAPTFLDLAGIEKPADMQGCSFRKLLRNKTPKNWRKSVYYHYYEFPHGDHSVKRHYGVRTERYKLIHFYYYIDAWELYDLEKDLDETNNVYNDPAYAEIVEKLKTELRRLQKHYGDTEELIQKNLKDSLQKHHNRIQKKKKLRTES
ncbi:MAG: sulfatase family protein [Planctomycetota bacterium]